MLVDAILYIVYGLVWTVSLPLRLLPDVSLPEEATSAISSIGTFLSDVGYVIPLSSLSAVIGAVLVIELAILTYKTVMWIVRRFPTQS